MHKPNLGDLLNSSIAYTTVTREPALSIKKNPGDFLMQGSNNSYIMLGEEKYTRSDKCQEIFAKDSFTTNKSEDQK